MPLTLLGRFTAFRAAFCVALLLSACAPVVPGRDGVLPDTPGGNVQAHLDAVRAHQGPVILSGQYSSAGNYWLGHPQACVVDGATFSFHQPADFGIFPITQDELNNTHAAILPMYRGELRDWYMQHMARSSIGAIYSFRTLTAAQIVTMGAAPWCG